MTQENNSEIIKTIGEQGEEVYIHLKEILTINDTDYALMSIVDDPQEVKTDDDEDEVIVMKMKKDEEDVTFEMIQDDDEFALVESVLKEEN
ncbi:DUF1292 domain-containing protein [bacterium]|nr:DUF1292 domain-containing protein [bacterium]